MDPDTILADRLEEGARFTRLSRLWASGFEEWHLPAAQVASQMEKGQLTVLSDRGVETPGVVVVLIHDGDPDRMVAVFDRSTAAALIGRLANALEFVTRE